MQIGINGRFLTRPTTGVDRYAREIVRELDGLLAPGEAIIAVPSGDELIEPLELKNIKVKPVGHRSGHAWEQLDYSAWLRHTGRIGLSLCNTAPMRNPGIVCIHDMAVRANASNYSIAFMTWYRVLYALLSRRSKMIITVSNFSKREIEHYYPAARRKITVAPNGWQHMERVEADEGIFGRYPEIKPGEYYFAMSSLAPNKNLNWLVETARLNPEEIIVIAGGLNSKVFAELDIPEAKNVVYPGYVSDGEAKALMRGCKGFLFPTFYEGFGIPPMEALSCGAPIAVSDTEVMHEVYGGSARYVDSASPCDDLMGLFEEPTLPVDVALSRYSWTESARKILAVVGAAEGGSLSKGGD